MLCLSFLVGGGYIPQQWRVVDMIGLLLTSSFAGLVPADYMHISLLNYEDSDILLTLVQGSEPIHDHLMLQMVPQLKYLKNEEYLVQYDELLQQYVGSMEEMIFSDLELIFLEWRRHVAQDKRAEPGLLKHPL